jgi:RNA polymerase sigma factor (TIGR02999 family)
MPTPDTKPAPDDLFEQLYADLRRIARSHMRRENAGHTLSATSLLHEAWFRMAAQDTAGWQNRAHFLAVASTMMRRILVTHAVAKRAAKREGDRISLTLAEAGGLVDGLVAGPTADVVEVHEALLAFEAVDPRAARTVELRFFGGLQNDEIAEVLGVSIATVKRDWDLARAWLRREMGAR